ALSADGLPVLLAFSGGRTPSEALNRLRDDWEIDDAGFTGVVDALVAQNLLTPAAGNDAALATAGFASPFEHFMMVRDTVRVSAYRRAIFRHCKDKTVVEIGCGSGILSIFAAQAGARRVIAIEESAIAGLAAAMFEANGVADRIELRRANSRDVTLDERADVIVHEVLGVDPFGENILPFIEDARERLLAPGGMLIPSALEVCCLGFEVPDRPYLDRARVCAELSELEGTYGIDFGAFRDFVKGSPDRFRRPLGTLGEAQFEPRILTAETQLCRIDFRPGSSLAVEPRGDLTLRVIQPGTLGGVLVYFRAQLDDDTILGNSPYAPRTSWAWNARPLSRLVAVEPGQELPIVTELRTRLGAQTLDVDLA
ncbi:MAG TPA: 50S ribosomal protein L11 methyltransferase, partial [Thermoanaerobaculia bacterium]|nr:50S ribosomal protein L11 methyltransferase [Thermoanaerobaculia bacterium]